jgi:hypothetical protein
VRDINDKFKTKMREINWRGLSDAEIKGSETDNKEGFYL